jgi:hypothetical protein
MGRILARLGEDVSFTHGVGSPVTVRGLFLAPYQSASFGGDLAIASSNPRFAALSSDLPIVAKGDTITRGAIVYKVLAPQADDPSGVTVLELEAP